MPASATTRSTVCPVCPAGALPPGETACPNCRTDLAPLVRLSDLRARLAEPGPGSVARRSLRLGGAGLAIGLVLGAFVGSRVPSRTRTGTGSAGTASRVSPGAAVPATPAAVVSARAGPTSSATPPPTATSRLEETVPSGLRELAGRLAGLPGLASKATSRSVELRPREPLFARGMAVPSPAAAALARRVAEALAESPHPLHVHLEGHTDPAPVRGRLRDNWTLGLARASALAREMEAVWGEPRTLRTVTVSLSSAGARPVPEGEGGEDAQRTVLVTITLAADPGPAPARR